MCSTNPTKNTHHKIIGFKRLPLSKGYLRGHRTYTKHIEYNACGQLTATRLDEQNIARDIRSFRQCWQSNMVHYLDLQLHLEEQFDVSLYLCQFYPTLLNFILI